MSCDSIVCFYYADISKSDANCGELFPVQQQQLQCKADSHHQTYPCVTKMTPNQAYDTHHFGSSNQRSSQRNVDSQQEQSLDDPKMMSNLAYTVHTFGFEGQQQPLQNGSNPEQVEARNVVYFQSHLSAQQAGVTDSLIASNPAYNVFHQQ